MALVGCLKQLRALYKVKLLETFQIQQSNLDLTVPEKSNRDQSCENPKRHPKYDTFQPMISRVHNNHYVILLLTIPENFYFFWR